MFFSIFKTKDYTKKSDQELLNLWKAHLSKSSGYSNAEVDRMVKETMEFSPVMEELNKRGLIEKYQSEQNREIQENLKVHNVLASSGNVNSQYILGLAYVSGIGVKKDEVEAAKWLKIAAGQGHEDAKRTIEYAMSASSGEETRNAFAEESNGLSNAKQDRNNSGADNVSKIRQLESKSRQGNAKAQFDSGNMSAKYKVVIHGIDDNHSMAQVLKNLSSTFNIPEQKLEVVFSNPSYVVKEGVEINVANKYLDAIEICGCIGKLEQENFPESESIVAPRCALEVGEAPLPEMKLEVTENEIGALSIATLVHYPMIAHKVTRYPLDKIINEEIDRVFEQKVFQTSAEEREHIQNAIEALIKLEFFAKDGRDICLTNIGELFFKLLHQAVNSPETERIELKKYATDFAVVITAIQQDSCFIPPKG